MNYYVYILECENGALYTGYTTDLAERYKKHISGEGAKYTRSFKPLRIVQVWRIFIDKSLAMQIEGYIKKFTRKQKLQLVAQPHRLVDLFGKEMVSVEPVEYYKEIERREDIDGL